MPITIDNGLIVILLSWCVMCGLYGRASRRYDCDVVRVPLCIPMSLAHRTYRQLLWLLTVGRRFIYNFNQNIPPHTMIAGMLITYCTASQLLSLQIHFTLQKLLYPRGSLLISIIIKYVSWMGLILFTTKSKISQGRPTRWNFHHRHFSFFFFTSQTSSL